LAEIEKKRLKNIKESLDGGLVHSYMPSSELSECDFGGRDTGRLLYWADDDPPCIYFGFVFRRDEMGHVSKNLVKEVMESIMIEKAKLIEEIKRIINERRNYNRKKL
jgi:hypothetical protein